MADNGGPVYLIDDSSDPPVLKIHGRASYLNCGPIAKVFTVLIKQGKASLQIDLAECTGMDSTFLGILAGAALEYRRLKPPGKLSLVNLNKRNMQLVRNLGLHCILEVCNEPVDTQHDDAYKPSKESAANRDQILNAHEHLIKVDKSNVTQFKEVLRFLEGNSEIE